MVIQGWELSPALLSTLLAETTHIRIITDRVDLVIQGYIPLLLIYARGSVDAVRTVAHAKLSGQMTAMIVQSVYGFSI